MTLAEAVTLFLDAQEGVHSPRTVEWYADRLPSLVATLGGDTLLMAISIDELRRWRAALVRRGLAVPTVHGYMRCARRLFRWLVEEGKLERSPALRLELPRLPDEPPKAVEQDDLARMLAWARQNSVRDYAILCLLADTGCRRGGLCGLRLGDLDLARRQATVREKGGRSRVLFLSEETVRALEGWLSERPGDQGDWLFVGRKGRLTGSGVYQAMRRVARGAGIAGRANPHAFRHGAARGMLENGADLGTVSQILGHRDIEVTHQFYARWTTQELQGRHRRFSWLKGRAEDDE